MTGTKEHYTIVEWLLCVRSTLRENQNRRVFTWPTTALGRLESVLKNGELRGEKRGAFSIDGFVFIAVIGAGIQTGDPTSSVPLKTEDVEPFHGCLWRFMVTTPWWSSRHKWLLIRRESVGLIPVRGNRVHFTSVRFPSPEKGGGEGM